MSLFVEPFLGAAALGQDAAEPVERCKVRFIDPPGGGMSIVASGALVATIGVDPLDDYRPQRSRDRVGLSDDLTEGEWRLKLNHPRCMRTVAIKVLIDGESFQAARESWLDSVRDDAQRGDEPADEDASPEPSKSEAPSKSEEQSGEAEEPGGESSAEEPAEETTEVSTEGGEDLEESPEAGLKTRSRSEPTLRERLLSYAGAVGEVDREELAWMLDRWPEGPPVTLLGGGWDWQRAATAPLWNLMDSDGDQDLSATEIAEQSQTISGCDINEDGIVELTEVQRKNAKATRRRRIPRAPLLELADVSQAAPDLSLRVDFQSKAGEVVLESVAGNASTGSTDEVVSVDFGPEYFECSAVSTNSASEDSTKPVQVAIGAVVDGFPLWRLIDLDGDNRLSAAERDTIPETLRGLDLNGDGELSAEEQPLAIRLMVGRGHVIHRLLQTPTPAAGREAPEPTAPAPEWFVAMDRNGDGELSRSEFSGAGAQFNSLDADGDGAVSVAEATSVAE